MGKYHAVTGMLFLASVVYHADAPNMAEAAERLAPVFRDADAVSPVCLTAALYVLENLEEALDSQSGTQINTLHECIQLLQDELWV